MGTTVISLTNLIRAAVLIPSAPLLGLLAERVSLATAFWAGGAIIAVLALPLLALWSPILRRDQQPPPTPEAAAPAQAD